MAFKTPLDAAIAHLIARGDIKSAADVARDLGLKSRGTVSSYASGLTKISPNFQTMFENKYGIRLKDFGQESAVFDRASSNNDEYKDKYIALLEQQLTIKEKRINEVVEHFNSELTNLKQAQGIIAAYVQAYFRAFATHRAKTERVDLRKIEAEMGRLYDEAAAQAF